MARHLIGQTIKAKRLAQGFSQAELGKRCGVSKACICHYERGLRTPTVERLGQIAQSLKLPIQAFYPHPGGEEEIGHLFQQLSPERKKCVRRYLYFQTVCQDIEDRRRMKGARQP